MPDIIEFMVTPLVACLLLIGIMVYFGIHVIKREIIFIDIALAQIAALGSIVAMVILELDHGQEGHVHDSAGNSVITYFFSIIFCTIAAYIFTLLKNKTIKIPLEAVIGIAYAVATTGAVIIMDKAAGGDVHIHDMLIGAILWVTWDKVIKLFVVVAIIGGFHYAFRKKFFNLTDNYLSGLNGFRNPKLWDFLFYFTFGIVIVEAVKVGGILTVFAFLILPASISALFARSWFYRILIGLVLGFFVTFFGLYLSWMMDMPSSPILILFLGIILIFALVLKVIIRAPTHQEGRAGPVKLS